jgi:hypothetical protein
MTPGIKSLETTLNLFIAIIMAGRNTNLAELNAFAHNIWTLPAAAPTLVKSLLKINCGESEADQTKEHCDGDRLTENLCDIWTIGRILLGISEQTE